MESKQNKDMKNKAKEEVAADNLSSEEQLLTSESENKSEDMPVTESTETEPVVEDFEAKYKDTYDKLIRQAAEYDNYRKRTLKEKSDLLKYGGETVLKNLLPVIDDLEIAMKMIDQSEDIAAVKEGIKLINQKFNDF